MEKTICCQGKLISFSTPKVMGILNLTPDSFFSESRTSLSGALKKAEQMLVQGATFIDVGGYSSRSGADSVSEEEEIARVVPAIEQLCAQFPEIRISVDTFRSRVAELSIQAGACIINDISGGELDPKIWQVAAQYQTPYIAMHMRGNPQTMQQLTDYQHLIKEMIFYFSQKIATAQSLGVNDLIIDPGFGFSKTLEQNYQLLQGLEAFRVLEKVLLVGVSRKTMIYKLLGNSPEQALNGTTAVNTLALLHGADILRVHDVAPAIECIQIMQAYKNASAYE